MRILIAGGGTGGHLFPGLAVAEEFKHRNSTAEVVFAGTESGLEAKVVPKEGYLIRFLRAEGLVGVTWKKKIGALVRAGLSMIDSYKILKAVTPDIVIGVGGYASGPVTLLAALMSIPTLVLEQNAVPGVTNRILGKFVDAICVTYQESMSFFPLRKTFLTGNPVRPHIARGIAQAGYRRFGLDPNLFTILIFGGSAGARSINSAVTESLTHLQDLRDNIQFLHQTGQTDYERIRNAYRESGFRGTIVPFIYEMGEAYAVADLVVSRAGATTLAELTVLGKPAILIPYPFAAANHQEVNARKLEEIGAAKLILDRELNGKILAHAIRELSSNEKMREEMARASRSVGRLDACTKVVDIAMGLVRQSLSPGAKSSA